MWAERTFLCNYLLVTLTCYKNKCPRGWRFISLTIDNQDGKKFQVPSPCSGKGAVQWQGFFTMPLSTRCAGRPATRAASRVGMWKHLKQERACGAAGHSNCQKVQDYQVKSRSTRQKQESAVRKKKIHRQEHPKRVKGMNDEEMLVWWKIEFSSPTPIV